MNAGKSSHLLQADFNYRERGMAAYADLQTREFAAERLHEMCDAAARQTLRRRARAGLLGWARALPRSSRSR